MKMMRVICGTVLGGAMTLGAAAQMAQQPASETKTPIAAASDDTGTDAATISDAKLCTMTVHEAWVASGRNEDRFFDLVKRAAEMSAMKRGVVLPDDQSAGTAFGNLVKATTRRDPDQLLYAVVDYAVRKTTSPSTTARR